MAAGYPFGFLRPSWCQLSAWCSCSPLAVSCGLGLPTSGAASDDVRRVGTAEQLAGKDCRDLGHRAGCRAGRLVRGLQGREAEVSEQKSTLETWSYHLMSVGTLGGWLQRRDTLKAIQLGRGQKQGWNHVPCCPGQYNCH